MAAGHLPNLALLRDIGCYLPLQSTVPPATFPAWTTCVTGVNPGRHGVFDFTELDVQQGSGARGQGPGLRFVNATHRMVPALWNILSEAGKRVGVLGVPATYPPEPVNGFMVAGFDSPVATGIDRSFVYPSSLYDAVRGWAFAEFQESRIGPGWHARALARLLGKIAEKERIAQGLLEREPWDFFMVVFGESDTVAHHFWLFHDPESPRHRADAPHRPGPQDAILQVYRRLDTAVGKLREAAGSDVTVGVVSDHGFGGTGTGVVHLNNWLAEQGHLRFTSGTGSVAKRLALAAVPERWQGALFRRFRGFAARAEAKSRFGGIDWPHTTAWSEELNYFPSIRVNLRGREPDGQVPPGDYEAFCRDLCALLEGWAPIKKAWRRDELYSGPFVSRAPDIVLELALENGYSHSCLRSRGGRPPRQDPFRRIGPDEFFGGKEHGMTGSHRPVGVLFLSKPSDATWARLEDVAPTVLAELSVPGPEMEGADLLGACPASVPPRPPSPPSACRPRPYSPEEERIVEQRLRDLGYLE